MNQIDIDAVNASWRWSDRFLPHAKCIIGVQLFKEAPLPVDRHEASDLIHLVSGTGNVAVRVRRASYMERFPYDVTFRAHRDTGAQTEMDKILDGYAAWMLYGFGEDDGTKFVRWTFINLSLMRGAMLRGRIVRKPLVDNGDGTQFEVFDLRELRAANPLIIKGSSHEIPDLPPSRQARNQEAA